MTRAALHDARTSEWVAALAAGVLVLVATALLVNAAVAQERTGDPAKWRNYWTQLYTVFTHPRCINCHGATDPYSGNNHGGGPLDEEEVNRCFGCHTANTVLVPGRCEGGWVGFPNSEGGVTQEACTPGDDQGEVRIAVGDTWRDNGPPRFVGLDMRALCLKVKKARGPEGLLRHVREDFLIGLAFEGKRGIADGPFGPVDAEPPPMSREEFAETVLRWISEAAMACSTDGSVALTDNLMIDMSPTRYGRTRVRNAIDAKVAIEREVATSDLRYDETSTLAFRPESPGCRATSDGEAQFRAEGKPVTRYEIQIGPNSTYRMRFLLGAVDGKTEFAYTEQLCRAPQSRREELPQPSTELRFGLDEWRTALPPPEGDRSQLILRGSTTVPNDDFTGAGVVSGGERKITWDIVIQ